MNIRTNQDLNFKMLYFVFASSTCCEVFRKNNLGTDFFVFAKNEIQARNLQVIISFVIKDTYFLKNILNIVIYLVCLKKLRTLTVAHSKIDAH